MAIPKRISIKEGRLPPEPGVYFMKDGKGEILYIGKATSLRSRVASYFGRPQEPRIDAMVKRVRSVDYETTPTAIEALVLESMLIKKHQPPYNVLAKDDRSMVHLAFTKEDFPKPVIIRAHELARTKKGQFLKVFGPFRSAASVRASLDALRRSFPWSACRPPKDGRTGRPCFYRHLGLCPGVCTGEIGKKDYGSVIRGLMRYFDGKRSDAIRDMRRQMRRAAERQDFERAAVLRERLYALDHIRDIAVMKREDAALDRFIDIFGRIEGYDVSNISGQDAVGSMVVFQDGDPKRSAYRKFLVKGVTGPNDTAMLREVLERRLARSAHEDGGWPLPDLILVDGGKSQVNAVMPLLNERGLRIPLIGIAKGPDRKRDELIYDKSDTELARLVHAFKPLLQRVRDEAHRFAVAYHKKRRAGRFMDRRDADRRARVGT